MSDKILAEKIKTNSNFIDDSGKFSGRIRKIFISNSLGTSEFEKILEKMNYKKNYLII